jgi:NADPH-dependent glutamate synthase beta subunit-like oxidoreductase
MAARQELFMIGSHREAKVEASRCLFCFDAVCKADCPAEIDVAGFIRRISQDNVIGAFQLVRSQNPLAWVCGILCPDDRLCASRCPRKLMDRAIDIRGLQAYASQENLLQPYVPRLKPDPGTRVAVIGAGPAGITAALSLSENKIGVDLFEAERRPGGLITYGIRPEKIDKKKALREIENLLGRREIHLHLKTKIANPRDLLKDHNAVYVATGLGVEKVNEKASRFRNALAAIAFLKKVNEAHLSGKTLRKQLGEDVLVIGGGNTAMDAAITARRVGVSNVTVVYRRTENEMPAWKSEVREALLSGVHFRFLLEPVSYEGSKNTLRGVVFRPLRLGRRGPDGRKRILPGASPTVSMNASSVIFATGRSRKMPEWLGSERIDPENGHLGKSMIWMGGELHHGVGLIVQAVADGKRAAQTIAGHLGGR